MGIPVNRNLNKSIVRAIPVTARACHMHTLRRTHACEETAPTAIEISCLHLQGAQAPTPTSSHKLTTFALSRWKALGDSESRLATSSTGGFPRVSQGARIPRSTVKKSLPRIVSVTARRVSRLCIQLRDHQEGASGVKRGGISGREVTDIHNHGVEIRAWTRSRF